MPSLTPTAFGGGGKIAFASDRDGDFEIYIMDPDGSSISQITDSDADYDYPEISRAGDLIVWDADLDMIRIFTPDGSERFLLPQFSGQSSWSPDGREVALVWTLSPGATDTADIIRINLEGDLTPLTLTSNPANDTEPAWSPDGEIIAFTSNRDGTNHIYLMNANGSGPRRLTSGTLPESEPDWSPDGERLAFVSGDNGGSQIFVVDSNGSNLRQLTDGPGLNRNPAWSLDGAMIVFWSDRTGNKEIYIVRIDGEDLIQITDSPADDSNPVWVQD